MPFVQQEVCKHGHTLDEKNTYLFERKDGRTERQCRKCRNKRTRLKRRPHLKQRGKVCEICGFIPVHECQLDTHHKDGDHGNNDPANTQTLCANCHRLVTLMQYQ